MGAIAEQRRLTRRCNGLLGGVGGVAKVLPAVELGVGLPARPDLARSRSCLLAQA